MRIDIIGNGESNSFADPQGVVIACNIPQHDFAYHCVAMIDTKPLHWIKQHGWHTHKEILCTPNVHQLREQMQLSLNTRPVFTHKHRWNTGHQVANYKSQEELHLWGMDSMFSTDLSSQCDSIIPRYRRPNLNRYWHPIWCEILNTISIPATLHIPNGQTALIEHEKLCIEYH